MINPLSKLMLLCGLILTGGCQSSNEAAKNISIGPANGQATLVASVVEASCGECQFDMEGNGCDLAVRIDGKEYFVDGVNLDDHGDAHSQDGMCNTIRSARVSGEIKEGRFMATAFELLPLDHESSTNGH